MSRRRCREVAELGSAYLDSALLDRERDRLLRHLTGCAPCRAELEELRAVRGLLGQLADGTRTAPEQLATRLVLIAGAESRAPLWFRPFRRTRAGVLPSARRRARARLTAAVLSLGGLIAAAGVGGYLAAPPLPAAVPEPGDSARSDFAALLSDLPLSNRPADALMVTAQAGQLDRTTRQAAASSVVKAQPIAQPAAVAALRRAAEAAEHVGFAGVQRVSASGPDGPLSANVRIVGEPGQGSTLTVLGSRGQGVLSRFVPPSRPAQLDAQVLALLLHDYAVAGWRGERLLGRPVTLVEAADPASTSGQAAARWWIDDATGLLLRQETYDETGRVAVAAGFSQLTISAKRSFLEHLAPRLAISTTGSAALASPAPGGSRAGGWPDQLAGMSLVQLRADDATEPPSVHLLYSDGIHTLSVLEQRGTLVQPPAGSSWDTHLHAYLAPGAPVTATWRSSDTVVTVVSDGPRSLVARAVAVLPHDPSVPPTTMGRVRAGWSRLADRVTG